MPGIDLECVWTQTQSGAVDPKYFSKIHAPMETVIEWKDVWDKIKNPKTSPLGKAKLQKQLAQAKRDMAHGREEIQGILSKLRKEVASAPPPAAHVALPTMCSGQAAAADDDAGLYDTDGYDEDGVHQDNKKKGKVPLAGSASAASGAGGGGAAIRALNAVNWHATILQDLVSHVKTKPHPLPSAAPAPAPAGDTAASLQLQIQLLEVQKELAAMKEKAAQAARRGRRWSGLGRSGAEKRIGEGMAPASWLSTTATTP
eukprot:131508-Rhodomonas_salina.1